MGSIIDTSDGKIQLVGGAVQLPSSATSVSSPASGSLRWNSTTDILEWYSAAGAWYAVGSVTYRTTTTLTTDTTLTAANIGQFIICNKTSAINISLPAISGLRANTGFAFDATESFITFHANGGDTIQGFSTFTVPKGAHPTIINDGAGAWRIISDFNPFAVVTPHVFESVSPTITAVGTNQGNAFGIAAKHNVVTTTPSSTGVRLPAYPNIGVGIEIVVINNGSNPLLVYPQTGGTINALSTNAPFSLEIGGKARFISTTSTAWLTFNPITLTGAVTGTGSSNITTSFASIASNNILANITGGSAAPIANTLTAVIDNAIGNVEGSVLYRGASTWLTLTPGTSGQFLQTLGVSSTPQWSNAVTSVATGTGLTGGPITTTGTISLASVSDGIVLSNITGGSAAPIANTLTAVIDHVIGNTQGDVLYRGASVWSVLAPGTSGQFLQTQGASANPQWASGVISNTRIAEYTFISTNTGSSAGRLTTDGAGAGASNVGALANNSAAIFDVELIAYDLTTPAAVTFTISGGLITRGANAAATVISGSPTFTAGTATSGAPSISTPPTVAADTVNGGFNFEFTPPIANTDTWHIVARTKLTLAF